MLNLSGQTVLVTGAGGFIGSHLVEALAALGCRVRALVQYNSRNSWGWLDHIPADVRREVEVLPGDIRDAALVARAVQGTACVFHLAALISIPYSYRAPQSFVDVNVTGTLNVLQAALAAGTAKVVQTSTSEVYGTARFVPITEEHPLQGQSPYSASKIGADFLAQSFHCSFGLPVATIRPFNTFGPRQSARAVIPTIITQIAQGQRVLKLGALSPVRDFNYVADTVSGFLAVAASDASVGQAINIGSGWGISIGDTVAAIARVMGAQVEITCDPQRMRPAASEVERLVAGTARARELLGWQPRYAGAEGFDQALELCARWFTDPANLAPYKSGVFNY